MNADKEHVSENQGSLRRLKKPIIFTIEGAGKEYVVIGRDW